MTTLSIRRLTSRPFAMTGLRLRGAAWIIAAVERKAMRSALAKLSDAHLDDIGLSYEAAKIEADKPFWRA